MPVDNGGQARFMAENLLKTGTTSMTTSGLNPSFPIGNLTSNFRGRPMKWRGRFLVEASNCKLYFNDGTNKVATVATSNYTTRTAFASAVQTALNAVSSSFFVVWNTGLQSFTIARSGGFTLRLSQTTDAIHNTMGFTGSTDIVVASTVAADQKRFHWPNEWLKIDFGYFPEIGFLGLISDSRYIFSLTEMANVRIQANTIDDFTAPPLDRVLTVTPQGILEFFDDDDYNYRFWKLIIEDNNGTDDPAIGYMYLGEFHKFGEKQDDDRKLRYNDQGGVYSKEDTSEKAVSESGQVYALEKQTQRIYDEISFSMLDPDAKDMLDDIWSRFKTVHPFFISIDPKLEITNKLSDSTFFCSFNSKPSFFHRSGNKYNTKIGVSEWL